MKIILKKNHEKNGVLYLEGQEIDVSQDEYQHIMNAYLLERQEMLKAQEEPPVEHFPKMKVSKK